MRGHGHCRRPRPWPSITKVFAPLFSKKRPLSYIGNRPLVIRDFAGPAEWIDAAIDGKLFFK
jgi:hypothetical protein